jgi:hypothetical protein
MLNLKLVERIHILNIPEHPNENIFYILNNDYIYYYLNGKKYFSSFSFEDIYINIYTDVIYKILEKYPGMEQFEQDENYILIASKHLIEKTVAEAQELIKYLRELLKYSERKDDFILSFLDWLDYIEKQNEIERKIKAMTDIIEIQEQQLDNNKKLLLKYKRCKYENRLY